MAFTRFDDRHAETILEGLLVGPIVEINDHAIVVDERVIGYVLWFQAVKISKRADGTLGARVVSK
jgi:hypothetical protein